MRISDWSSDVCSSDLQLGRGSHRAHHLVELILAVAVPERELRQVAPGERRLLAGDCVQCDFRPGDDLLAVLARDTGMVLDPLGDRKSIRLNSSHYCAPRMPSYARININLILINQHILTLIIILLIVPM